MSDMSDMRDFPVKKKYTRREVEELLKELDTAQAKIDRLESDKATLIAKLDALGELQESIPEDCVRGQWCHSCEFNRTFSYMEYGGYHNHGVRVHGHMCAKGKSCPNFVERKCSDE